MQNWTVLNRYARKQKIVLILNWIVWNRTILAQSDEASEYTDSISAEREDSLNECPVMTLNNLMVSHQ